MRILLTLILFFLLAQLQAFGQGAAGAVAPLPAQPSASASKERGLEEELSGAERELAEAFRQRDEAALKSILTEDFSQTSAPSETMNKAQFIESARHFKINSFSLDHTTVRAFGGTLLLSGIYRQTVSAAPVERTDELFITDVWVRRAARWQLAARYASRRERSPSALVNPPARETPPPAPVNPGPLR